MEMLQKVVKTERTKKKGEENTDSITVGEVGSKGKGRKVKDVSFTTASGLQSGAWPHLQH